VRLLIVHPGGVGDVLLALPAVRSLRRHHGAELGLLAVRQVAELLLNCREVETVFPLESGALAELLAGEGPDTSRFVCWLRRCEWAQCWMADRHGELRAALAAQGVERMVIASPMAGLWQDCHQIDRYLQSAECPQFQTDADGSLHVTEIPDVLGRTVLASAGVPYDRPYLVIHPGSGSIHKCCHPSILAAILDWAVSKDLMPVIVQGPADEQQVAGLKAQWPRQFYLLKDCELSTLAGIIQRAVLYVGHDSGLTHLAAALAVPTVACFGPTDEGRWGPRGRFVAVVRGGPCRCATWDTVQKCGEKPCLTISSSSLISACERMVALFQP